MLKWRKWMLLTRVDCVQVKNQFCHWVLRVAENFSSERLIEVSFGDFFEVFPPNLACTFRQFFEFVTGGVETSLFRKNLFFLRAQAADHFVDAGEDFIPKFIRVPIFITPIFECPLLAKFVLFSIITMHKWLSGNVDGVSGGVGAEIAFIGEFLHDIKVLFHVAWVFGQISHMSLNVYGVFVHVHMIVWWLLHFEFLWDVVFLIGTRMFWMHVV